jgi:acyl-coenzyme A synthetase/AMP-(fatty) acid ligase
MNCVDLLVERARACPDRPALWQPRRPVTTFAGLVDMGARAQALLRRAGVDVGDAVLVFDPLGPRLYATVLGAMALGASVVLVEPWMPAAGIERVVRAVRPKAFAAGWLGRLWGTRSPAVRAIDAWCNLRALAHESGGALHVEPVAAEARGVVAFTSGTTGAPKGVVRTHGNLVEEHRVLERHLGGPDLDGPDLCIFASFVLSNLASGRTSIVAPPGWPQAALAAIADLPAPLRPVRVTAGPAFLLALLRQKALPPLRGIHVGGALTDCWIHEEILARWPDARCLHVYGSSEAEPVSTCDLATAVRASRARDLFQTLCLGRPIPEIRAEAREDGLWVAGPHVSPTYLGDEQANRSGKRTDARGEVWHAMGDRIDDRGEAWWYAGRAAQCAEDFSLEQRVYAWLGSSKAFVHRDPDGARVLCGERISRRKASLRRAFPEIVRLREVTIVRDRRHRARIDRAASLRQEAP